MYRNIIHLISCSKTYWRDYMKKLILIPITLALILVALIQSPQATTSNQKYKEHYFGNIHIQLPQSAKVIENKIEDSELLPSSIYFDDKELLLRGYIQLWQLTDAEKFLALSKEHSTYDFSLFTLTPITCLLYTSDAADEEDS